MATISEKEEAIFKRIEAAEERLKKLEDARRNVDPVDRVQADLLNCGVYTARFLTVPSNYYDLTLEQRAELLHGEVPQLCKSIIFENTACDHFDTSDVTNSRYYCVIVQYVGKSHYITHDYHILLFMSFVLILPCCELLYSKD